MNSSSLLYEYSPQLEPTLREYCVKYREKADRIANHGEYDLSHGRTFARSWDGLLSAVFSATQATLNLGFEASLAAIGSYGRGVLAPRSDLDVRILVYSNAEQAEELASTFFYPLWDAGCSLGHQVLTIDSLLALAREDFSTATTLLDLRCVSGNAELCQQAIQRAFESIFSSELSIFIERLRQTIKTRHEHYGDSLYLLEPDVKNGAGGLRDIDSAWWAARARFRIRNLSELIKVGILSSQDYESLEQAERFLWKIRGYLHAKAGRRSERLTFDTQEELGHILYAHQENESNAIAAERLMQTYYQHARVVSHLVESILDRCDIPKATLRTPMLPERVLAPGICTFQGSVTFESSLQLEHDPALAFRLYHTAMIHHLPIYSYARDRVAQIVQEVEFRSRILNHVEASKLFLDCLIDTAERKTHSLTSSLSTSIVRELHDVGLLLAMIPEFAPVVGRVHHDTYHVYTVDVHSVAAVERLQAFARGDFAAEFPLACRLASELTHPKILYVATLLHDIGKGERGLGHSERGAEMAHSIGQRLGLSTDEIIEVQWLIREHLTMYHIATRRDVEDASTIRSFAELIVHNASDVLPSIRLRLLYLLTVADISTTSPSALNSWKAQMLEELFLATQRALVSHESHDSSNDMILQKLYQQITPTEANEFLLRYLQSMPRSYWLLCSAEMIVAHSKVVLHRNNSLICIEQVPARFANVIELCVVAKDRPGLLAIIAATLTAHRLEILTAHIFSRSLSLDAPQKLEAVDLFQVRRVHSCDEDAARTLSAREISHIQADLTRVVEGKISPYTLIQERRGSGARGPFRTTPTVPIHVEIENRASQRYTILDVYAQDRPGLLFVLAETLHSLQLLIARSKISTEGSKVADSFYVTELDGSKINDLNRQQFIKKSIYEAMQQFEQQ